MENPSKDLQVDMLSDPYQDRRSNTPNSELDQERLGKEPR